MKPRAGNSACISPVGCLRRTVDLTRFANVVVRRTTYASPACPERAGPASRRPNVLTAEGETAGMSTDTVSAGQSARW